MNKDKLRHIIFFSHLLIGFILVYFFKLDYFINPEHNGWDWFWQSLPTKYLRYDLLKSIWVIHGQPPLHNFLFGIFIKLFYPYHYLMFQIFSVFIGAATTVLLYDLCDKLIYNIKLKTVLFLIIFFNPAVFLYENYLLYTLNSGFLAVLSVWIVMRFSETGKNFYIYFLTFIINILILYRSSFHIIFIPALICFIYFFMRKNCKTIIICVLISFLSIGWCAKNYVLYGFFGTSSWYGLNIYKFITTDFNQELRKKVLSGVSIPESVSENNHFYTEDLSKYFIYGFNKKSGFNALNDNNFHNINIPEISKIHSEAAFKIIKLIPVHYLKNTVKSFILFNQPSFTYDHLNSNRVKIKGFVDIYANTVFFDNCLAKKIFNRDIYLVMGILSFAAMTV
ncbi:MAG TPA: hypothetical protein PLQ81_01880, partial [bacterium]|nr:hypothetical protein [bacterium]